MRKSSPNLPRRNPRAAAAAGWLLAGLVFAGIFLAGSGGSLRAEEEKPAATASAANTNTNTTATEPAAAPATVPEEASLGRVKDFFVPDYFDPPDQNKIKSLLRGAEARPQPNARVYIKEAQLETYRLDGKAEMIVRAPECIYNQATQTASSTNRIEARSGDGRLFIEGEGFNWEQTNSVFTISNRVHTIIRSEPEKTTVP